VKRTKPRGQGKYSVDFERGRGKERKGGGGEGRRMGGEGDGGSSRMGERDLEREKRMGEGCGQ